MLETNTKFSVTDRQELLFLSPPDLEIIRRAIREQENNMIELSLDLGLTSVNALLSGQHLILSENERVPLPVDFLSKTDNRTILIFENGEWQKWQRFDQESQKYYKMIHVAGGKPPTVEISGIKMHVTKDSDPVRDTHSKLSSLKELKGNVLDTCMGMGYTAIESGSRSSVRKVYVCEKDPNMFKLCWDNPWSRDLFENEKIQPVLSDVQRFISQVPDRYFEIVIHDPPRFALAPELYSEEFYRKIFRVMVDGGRMYHYTGNPNQKVRKKSLDRQSGEILKKVGFRIVQPAYFGLTAIK